MLFYQSVPVCPVSGCGGYEPGNGRASPTLGCQCWASPPSQRTWVQGREPQRGWAQRSVSSFSFKTNTFFFLLIKSYHALIDYLCGCPLFLEYVAILKV